VGMGQSSGDGVATGRAYVGMRLGWGQNNTKSRQPVKYAALPAILHSLSSTGISWLLHLTVWLLKPIVVPWN